MNFHESVDGDSLVVEKVLWRRVQPGDLFHAEKRPAPGAKGQLHIDLSPVEPVARFLNVDLSDHGQTYSIDLRTIGDPTQLTSLELKKRPNSRWSFPRQNRLRDDHQRPPAWTEKFGWPAFANPPTDKDEAEKKLNDIKGLYIYIVKVVAGGYYAGMTTGIDDHSAWPDEILSIFDNRSKNTGCIVANMESHEISPLALRIIESLKENKNVMVYGPPGTGKSHAVAEVYRSLRHFSGDLHTLTLDPSNTEVPFGYSSVDLPFPPSTRAEWVTFHPDYGYEDFVKGLRPTGDGFELEPVAGVLLDLALDVSFGPSEGALLVVDEINRGNVPRILGDFITFMDEDYREGGNNPLDSTLAKTISDKNGISSIRVSFDEPIEVDDKWQFPKDVYLLATMNSVDKSVAPIDSAIGRRFARIDAFADYDFLADALQVDLAQIESLFRGAELESKVRESPLVEEASETDNDRGEQGLVDVSDDQTRGVDVEQTAHRESIDAGWNARKAAVALLVHLNREITRYQDRDSTLGHAYLIHVTSWTDLARVWDKKLFPQLQDRFSVRPDVLHEILRVKDGKMPKDYPFKPDSSWVPLPTTSLEFTPESTISNAFHFLIFGSNAKNL